MATDPLRLLLDAAVCGDNQAMEELVRRTHVDVVRLCTALGSRGEVEDLVQETYLRATISAPRFRGEGSVKSWLLTIARNVCADHVRRRTRRRRLADRLEQYADRSDHVVAGPGPRSDALLEDLSDERREAFVLTQVVGLPYEEAAEVLGCPIGTIRSRVARARADLLAAHRRSLTG